MPTEILNLEEEILVDLPSPLDLICRAIPKQVPSQAFSSLSPSHQIR